MVVEEPPLIALRKTVQIFAREASVDRSVGWLCSLLSDGNWYLTAPLPKKNIPAITEMG
jgi:hypothetical protein